jgi:signal transduction histidine kinase
MRKVLLFIFCCLLFTLIQGQQKIIDSLKKFLSADNDTLRLVHSQLINEAYNELDRDSAIVYARQYEQLSQKLNYKINYADALRRIAESTEGNDAADLDSLFKSEKVLETNEDGLLLPLSYLKQLRVPKEINSYKKYNQYVLANVYLSLGIVYWNNAKHEAAMIYFNRVLEIAEKLQAPDLLSDGYFTVGVNYLNDDTSLLYMHKARNLALQNGFVFKLGLIEDYLAKEYRFLKDYKNQLIYLRASLQHHLQQGELSSTGWAYIGIGEYYQKNEPNYDSALYFLNKAFIISQTVKASQKGIEYWSSRFLYEIYHALGNKDSALKYVDIMLKAKELVFNEDQAHEFETKDYLERKQRTEEEKENATYRSNVKTYSLLAGLLVFIALAIIFWRNNKRRQREYIILQKQKARTDEALQNLRLTQQQLVQSEKMASLGELTAGIAHEIQNPLNFVNNFSELNKELADELKAELATGNMQFANEIVNDIKDNSEKINHHGKRADAIVKGMLQHSRTSSGTKELTDINALCDEYLRLAYHGLRAKDKTFNVITKTEFDNNIGKINVVPQEMGRVILNLINNAFYVVSEKAKQNIDGYEPTVTVTTKKENNKVIISVADNGTGIPQKVVDKIFQPFFTTKPTGQGTGLGLSLAYDIITKGHSGELKATTNEGKGSTFIITLPV